MDEKMRKMILSLGMCCLIVGGCARATATQVDSGNPAQCLAAFNYARMILKRGPNPDEASALDMSARMTFESLKLRKAGKFNEAMAEGQNFSRDHGTDKAVMMGLLGKCGATQDANPEFQAAMKSGYLKELSRMIEERSR